MWNLFLDDLRSPSEAVNPLSITKWVIARSVTQAKELVAVRGAPIVVSFDHDLGVEEGNDGYAFAKWLVEKDLDAIEHHRSFLPPDFKFQVHSANPIGAANIEHLLTNWLRYKRTITESELLTLKELLKETP
jgi:hypothetical protein